MLTCRLVVCICKAYLTCFCFLRCVALLLQASETRVLGGVGGTVLLTGDSNGIVRVFNWKPPA